jgi:hypothetical protein
MAEVLEWIEDVSDRDTCKTIVELKRSPCIDPHGSEPVIILDAADWKRIEDAVVNLPEPNEKLVELFYGIKITRA